ncbi:MAG TPA: hypothetical protein VHE30_15170 [Polyangiaceae bacterium]|nr:hypothetical protein [Polyangiaceae bacterium]
MTLRTHSLAFVSSIALAACGHSNAFEASSPAHSVRGGGATSVAEQSRAKDAYAPAADQAVAAAPAPMPESPAAGARAEEAESAAAPAAKPGLGTSWGEQVDSQVRDTRFSRADGDSPTATAAFFYNDESGVAAMAGSRYLNWSEAVTNVAGGRLTVSLTDAHGNPLRAAHAGGRTLAVGSDGDRYVIRVENHTPYRVETVATVDGLDVVSGEDGDFHNRGYVVAPYDTLEIEGFRESSGTVRAFRFGAVEDSYAERRGKGRNVGVVGVALFREAGTDWRWSPEQIERRETADPFPNRFAPPPPSRPYRMD